MSADPSARILALAGVPAPTLDATAFVAAGAVLVGDVRLAARASVWYNAVLRAENAHFTLIWENASRAQKLVLQALAEEPGRPFGNAYRARHSLPAPSGVQRALRPLVDSETIARHSEGHYDLAEPFLREWIVMHVT